MSPTAMVTVNNVGTVGTIDTISTIDTINTINTIDSSSVRPEKMVLRFKKLTQEATKPSRASEQSAGYDLYSAYDTLVPAKGKALVKTDLQLQIPGGCYGRIAPRSGLALKHSIDVGAGVIDADYRGNVGVILFNFGDSDFQVRKGDRIAQLICERIAYPELEEATENDDLETTKRGSNGFGSSGLN